jgi:hypothetical protein
MSATATRRRPAATATPDATPDATSPVVALATAEPTPDATPDETPSNDAPLSLSNLWLAGWTYGTGRAATLRLFRELDLDNKQIYKATKAEWMPGAMAAYKANANGRKLTITQELVKWANDQLEAVGFHAASCPAEKQQRTKLGQLAYNSTSVQFTNLVKAAKLPEVTEPPMPRQRNTSTSTTETKAAKAAKAAEAAKAAKATEAVGCKAGTRQGFRALILQLRNAAAALKSANLKLADNDTNKALDTIIEAVNSMEPLAE